MIDWPTVLLVQSRRTAPWNERLPLKGNFSRRSYDCSCCSWLCGVWNARKRLPPESPVSFFIALYLTSFVARDCYWIAGNGLKEEEHGYVKVIKMWMMGFIKLALVFFSFSFSFFCCDWMKRCIERGYCKIVSRVAWICVSMNFIQRSCARISRIYYRNCLLFLTVLWLQRKGNLRIRNRWIPFRRLPREPRK